MRLDFFKYKSSSASVKLEWHPPHGIPSGYSRPQSFSELHQEHFVIRQPFPPDDSSIGYERGSAVSKQWDEATTFAAIETANWVAEHLDQLASTSMTDKDRLAKTRAFSNNSSERAFRRPLTAEQQQLLR